MKVYSRNIGLVILCFMLISLTGCASKPSTYYLLNPAYMPKTSKSKVVKPIFYLGIGDINIPKYLSQPEIVTRTSTHEIKKAEFNRWAEPLQQNIERVLMTNITSSMPKVQLEQYPWPRTLTVKYRIDVNISEFDTNNNGLSILNVEWQISDGTTQKVLYKHLSVYRQQAHSENYQDIVIAMNQNLDKLSQAIVASVKKLYSKN